MNNLISFPQTAAFFLPQVGRCLPGLTEVVIELATMVQRGEIEEELLKLKLRQRCFVALARMEALEALIFEFPGDGSDSVGFRSPETRAPLRFYSGAPGSGVHVANPAVTHRQDAAAAVADAPLQLSPGGSGAQLQSGPSPASLQRHDAPHCDGNDPVPRTAKVLPFDPQNPYPKGRW